MDERQAIEQFVTLRTEEAFVALFTTCFGRVRRYFVMRGLAPEEAEDLAQNVMVIVYQRASEIRDPALFLAWLFKVAYHEWVKHWRQAQTRHRLAPCEPLSDELVAHLRLEPPDESSLRDWLDYLEPGERDLVLLRYVEELSYEELAAALHLPLGTVKWRLFQVKKKLIPILNATLPPRSRRQIH